MTDISRRLASAGLLRRMGICPNAYYNYRKDRKESYHTRKEQIKEKILKIYHEYSGNPGYRMMRVYLLRANIQLSNTTTLKYMQELKIRSTITLKRPAYKKGDCYKKFENHLNRNFHAEKPNEKWCTDFTYIMLEDGRKRYNCSIIDLYDRSVVATQNSSHICRPGGTDTGDCPGEKQTSEKRVAPQRPGVTVYITGIYKLL